MTARSANTSHGGFALARHPDAAIPPIDPRAVHTYADQLSNKYTPPASPRESDSVSLSSFKSNNTNRSKHPLTLLTESAQYHSSPEDTRHTPSPEPSRPGIPAAIPPPHLPLRRSSSQRLRQHVIPATSSPLNEERARKTGQPSPTYSTNSGRSRQGRATPIPNDDPRRNALSSNPVTSWHTPAADHPLFPPNRSRGLTTSSQPGSQFQPSRVLRSSTSIPDYGPVRLSNRTGPSTTYKPDRGQPSRDSYHSTLRRDPFIYSDEARASFRSGWTNGSGGFLDASGTERSSIVTKRSSTSENRMSSHQPTDDGLDPDAEGMSVDDYISMYAEGFYDDPVEGNLDNSDEGYVSAALAPNPEPQEQPEIRRRHSASMVRESMIEPPEKPFSLAPPKAFHARSSTAIFSGKPLSIQGSESTIPIPRDRYGFKKSTQYVTADQYDVWNLEYTDYLARRRKKWEALMKHFGLSTDKPTRFPPRSDKVKRYIRKGIPPEWRGAAWFWYAGGVEKLEQNPGLYWDLVEQVDQGQLNETDRDLIERDLNRTFPDNIRFKPDFDPEDMSMGRDSDPTLCSETAILRALRRVLQAFAIHNPGIGYCQSLNFLAGLLLLFLDEDEEKAFHMLSIITSIHLPGTHSRVLEANVDMGVLMSCIREFMPAIWPKIDDVSLLNAGTHFSSKNARLPTVSLATTAWFMSLFVGNLPIETVLRVWDSFFYEGSKTLFRISLAIFKVGEPDIRPLNDHMEIFQVIQTIPRRMLDANKLMEACFRRRNGFGHMSQDTIDSRRAERRKQHQADLKADKDRLAASNGGKKLQSPPAPVEEVGEPPSPSLRRSASKRFKRSMSRKRTNKTVG